MDSTWFPKVQNKHKWGIVAIGAAIILSAAIGGASAYYHWGPFAAPQKETTTAPQIDYGPYMANVQRTFKSHWHPPYRTDTNRITVLFKIHKNGEISNVGFDRMSRISEADAAALKAVIESMPAVPPLPDGAPDSVDVRFTFDYDVYHGTSGSSQTHK